MVLKFSGLINFNKNKILNPAGDGVAGGEMRVRGARPRRGDGEAGGGRDTEAGLRGSAAVGGVPETGQEGGGGHPAGEDKTPACGKRPGEVEEREEAADAVRDLSEEEGEALEESSAGQVGAGGCEIVVCFSRII